MVNTRNIHTHSFDIIIHEGYVLIPLESASDIETQIILDILHHNLKNAMNSND